MNTPEGQMALLKLWATDTNLSFDAGNQPKVEFARLAKVKGWVGGDATWCLHWNACFGEIYNYGARRTLPTPAVAPDLIDCMRRLSIDSSASSFSVISSPSSVQSLDSVGSIIGGVAVLGLANSDRGDRQVNASTASAPVSGKDSKANTRKARTKPATAKPTPSTPKASPFWYQFPGFVPIASANFKDEFARLAKHQSWGAKVKRKHQIEALTQESAFHYGTCMEKLDRWQDLCKEVGIEKVPTSITQCKKALKSIFVNLFNLIDHRRNPEVQIVHFKSYGAFSRNIRNGNQFPRECAKQDGFIKVLLKKL
ncbi:uncharacterized protein K460DRAFT_345378 [Cucurbitaria berberidis CBS 394.84]|uniref:Uncharacterized protein n=1 Tax=Cucurbitaria berberidis CBS 394.84 TaxID=1168544 RepID=A0A9P4GAC8_9PLEO|nr:uncharacterized protein K460DRAFT_345378 [Cucurbitaria berberidis CBS 394.84]KAF1841967.1 hypothetical protein K460DRAFT_345378 [Cucurbitaria berberidis CBS 394.84]